MKKLAITLLLAVYFYSLVSASYICSDNSSLSTEEEPINVGRTKTIDYLPMVLMKTQLYLNGEFQADLNIEGKKVTLSLLEPTKDIIIADTDYNITLLNLTGYIVDIGVSGSSKKIEEFEFETIKGLDVYVGKVGENTVDVFAGLEVISLSSAEGLSAKYSSNETKEYQIELISAFSDYAIIRVSDCKTGEIVEIEDEVEENETIINNTNSSFTNSTNSTDSNITLENSENETLNDSVTSRETNASILGGETGKGLEKIYYFYFAIGAALIILAVIFFIIFRRRNSAETVEKPRDAGVEPISSFGGAEIINQPRR